MGLINQTRVTSWLSTDWWLKKETPRGSERRAGALPAKGHSAHEVMTEYVARQLLYQPEGGGAWPLAGGRRQRRRKRRGGCSRAPGPPSRPASCVRLQNSPPEGTLPCRENDACWDMLENDDCCLATLRDMWKSEVHCWRTKGPGCRGRDHLKIEQPIIILLLWGLVEIQVNLLMKQSIITILFALWKVW